MRELFFKIFSDTPFNSGITLEVFNVWHILYIVVILALIAFAAITFRNKTMATKEKVLRILAGVLLFSYVSDFFVHDFVYSDYHETGEFVGGGLNMDKLPFHLCTTMCIILFFVTFNQKLRKFLEPIAAIAITGSLMYMCYPADGCEPWCYRMVQTMFFHGVEMAWGVLAVSMGLTKLRWKNIWQSYVLLIGIAAWAKLGNELLEYNWFFLTYNPFYIDALDSPWLLPIIVPAAVFGGCVIIYGAKSGIAAICKKYGIHNNSAEVIPFSKPEEPALAEVAATEETNE